MGQIRRTVKITSSHFEGPQGSSIKKCWHISNPVGSKSQRTIALGSVFHVTLCVQAYVGIRTLYTPYHRRPLQ
jgi:hypothetical protein